MANENLTAQQRAALFGASTRQHFQMLGTENVTGAQTVSFRVPKSRIMQGIRLYVDGKLKVTHASANTCVRDSLAAYRCIRRVSIDFNNGFSPIVVSGAEMAMMNMLYPKPEMVLPNAAGNTLCKIPDTLTASTTGADNAFELMLDIPLTLNYRDPVGLVLAQNAETNIDIVIDFAPAGDMIKNAAGYTAAYNGLTVTPQVTSFSIPSDTRAFPDMSVLKVVDSRNDSIVSGQNYVKLPVGMIYRKMILCFEKSDGSAFADSDITSNIELVMNTADIPYSISPKMLKAVNKMQSGQSMPDGVYYFSFDYQGMNGYGGARDYIDAERISEFAVRFSAGCAGKITVISEKLTRLITSK